MDKEKNQIKICELIFIPNSPSNSVLLLIYSSSSNRLIAHWLSLASIKFSYRHDFI